MGADDSMMADEPFNIGRSDRDRNGKKYFIVSLKSYLVLLLENRKIAISSL